MKLHDCDICGSEYYRHIWMAAKYTDPHDTPVICQNCGFVYVKLRRSSAEIAEDWKRIYKDKIYDPTWPGVKARLYYAAEWIDQNIGLEGKSLLDIGGGAGTFRDLVEDRFALCDASPSVYTFDPAMGMDDALVENFEPPALFDIVTILWTLENCGDCNAMISKARECLKPNGHLVVATGSRILVPFRKPMSMYFSTEPQDLHAFRWSVASLDAIFRKHGFWQTVVNDHEQNDVMVMRGQPHPDAPPTVIGSVVPDDPTEVENHFIDWYRSFP